MHVSDDDDDTDNAPLSNLKVPFSGRLGSAPVSQVSSRTSSVSSRPSHSTGTQSSRSSVAPSHADMSRASSKVRDPGTRQKDPKKSQTEKSKSRRGAQAANQRQPSVAVAGAQVRVANADHTDKPKKSRKMKARETLEDAEYEPAVPREVSKPSQVTHRLTPLLGHRSFQ